MFIKKAFFLQTAFLSCLFFFFFSWLCITSVYLLRFPFSLMDVTCLSI
jgi:hypothetical protein